MNSQYQVVVYGASGYTGKLVAWKLAERGIPFIAAGRDQSRLEAEMAKVPELKGHAYKCVAVKNDKAALTDLFTGRKVVINVAGPFMQLGQPVVEACLAAGCHYFDTTGETDWMLHVEQHFGEAFAARDLALAPANSYMWMEGALAAEVALETPGIDSLDLVYYASSETSVASTMSFLRMCTKPQHFLQNKQLALWPYAQGYDVQIPGIPRPVKALPWGGGGEPIWYRDDPRVRNCSVLVAFANQERFMGVLGILEQFERDYRHLSAAEQEEVTNSIGRQVTQVEPAREIPEEARCVLSCQGRGNTQSVSVILRGNSPYSQTGVFGAEAALAVLTNRLQKVGFGSAAQIVGARKLLSAQAAEGFLSYDVVAQ